MSESDTPTEIETNIESPPRGDLIDAIRAMFEESRRPRIVGITDPVSKVQANIALLPNGEFWPVPGSIFDDYLERPRFRMGTAILTSLTSFIAHVTRFKDEESIVFACDDRDEPSLTAVLDYHPANVAIGEGVEKQIGSPPPRHGRHRSHFTFPLSDEWVSWKEKNDQYMSMADFALFLEDRIVDVAAPGEIPLSDEAETFIKRIGGRDRIATPSELVELSRGLRVNENAAISNAVNLASGEGEIMFASEHTDASGNKLSIPTSFQLAIPVFRSDDPYAVIARLRYRPRPTLMFKYELWRVDRVFDHAFTEAAVKVAEETGLSVLLGAPEA